MFLIPEGSRRTGPHKHDGAFKELTILKFLEESDSGKSNHCQNNFHSTGRKKGCWTDSLHLVPGGADGGHRV